ncbi:MAG: isoleucine--tRNA ligase [Clostridia bacterium]|nr:isoleucine--tRNA ligase [Clostridia bacterium]
MAVDYTSTLNLPKTDFSMRANLPQREPDMQKATEENKIYEKLLERNEGKPSFVLHDGPPFSNGNIHMGTAMNKILKDFIIKSKAMTGHYTPYVPGWDNHGMPIESAIIKKTKMDRKKLSVPEFRRRCHEFAQNFVDIQMAQFKRLGVLADWEHPYLTMKPSFEAREVKVFGEMYKNGYIYKGLKPVYWCADCQTALAEAEIEYGEDPCYSIYVKFAVTDDKGVFAAKGVDPSKVRFVIWTTTTWTLPANVAICLGPDFTYQLIKAGDEYYVMADALSAAAMAQAGIADYEVVAEFKGAELEYITVQHPFLDRRSLVIVGDHVTLESGTGCVHTAPGHGVEDFEVCKKYPEIPVIVPVDNQGMMTEEAGAICAGMKTDDANKAIAVELEKNGSLFAMQKIIHQYPHCWRCKKPVLFRATDQWFCSVDSFKKETLEQIAGIKWMPGWGENRIASMVSDRADWCISRQRLWGVPIPVFYCEDCGKPVIDREFIQAVSDLFRKEGSNAWYTHTAAEILPEGATCPHCGGHEFRKEKDIMDVWFDSGSSHAAVLKERPYLKWPADMYMEGGDQYRGWFQSSLLTAVACTGEAPYRSVLTHGWVVDGEGKAMHKSAGNAISPSEVIDQYGADILRLWVASLDYTVDAHLSKDILKQLSESYRKIRNTARFILGNIHDFDPNADAVADEDLLEIDRWALMRLTQLNEQVTAAYESYAFHDALHKMHNFCVVDMSNFYLDVLKDRLYVEKADGVSRRAAQTTIYRILNALTRMLAPILAFTAEEIWGFLPHTEEDDARAVVFNELPRVETMTAVDDGFMARWDRIHAIREDVQKALELARTSKLIGKSLDAKVTLFAQGETAEFLADVQAMLPEVFIVSKVELNTEGNGDFSGELEGLSVTVAHADGEKCCRCWSYTDTVGSDAEHPELCARCAAILK